MPRKSQIIDHNQVVTLMSSNNTTSGPVLQAVLIEHAKRINAWMDYQGFWESSNKGEKIALMHSELSECLEAVRKNDQENEVEELADTVIRILDYCGQHNLDLGAAITKKMEANFIRPRKHGKGF